MCIFFAIVGSIGFYLFFTWARDFKPKYTGTTKGTITKITNEKPKPANSGAKGKKSKRMMKMFNIEICCPQDQVATTSNHVDDSIITGDVPSGGYDETGKVEKPVLIVSQSFQSGGGEDLALTPLKVGDVVDLVFDPKKPLIAADRYRMKVLYSEETTTPMKIGYWVCGGFVVLCILGFLWYHKQCELATKVNGARALLGSGPLAGVFSWISDKFDYLIPTIDVNQF